MKKVLLAMSGGVDSSVAASILLNQGYDVTGATFTLWKLNNRSNNDDISDAKEVCKKLCIPHMVFDFSEKFKEAVVENFVLQYKNGFTPSPCIVCNREIKFGIFYEQSMKLGFDLLATGHYARIIKEDQDYYLKTATFKDKDQSYFLYSIPHNKLKNILFPLGNLSKDQVRKMAANIGLNTAFKSDSQEICFINGKYTDFLKEYIGYRPTPGNFIDKCGNVIGKHTGIWNYTVGQRKGLGVSFGKPMFVKNIDANNNTIQLVDYNDTFCNGLIAKNVCWQIKKPSSNIKAEVKIRSKSLLSFATITPKDDVVEVIFEKPHNFIAPGQSVVFYDGDTVIGGGIITSTIN